MNRKNIAAFAAMLMILGLSSLSAAGMTVTWEWLLDDADVTAYRYQLDGEDENGWSVVGGDVNTYKATGLDPAKEYTLYLQRSYDGENWSPSAQSTASAMLAEGEELSLPEAVPAAEPAPAQKEAPAAEPAPVQEEAPAEERAPAPADAAMPAAVAAMEAISLASAEKIVPEQEAIPAEEAAPAAEPATAAEPPVQEETAAAEPVPASGKDGFRFTLIPRFGAGVAINESTPLAEFGFGLDFVNIIPVGPGLGFGLRSDIAATFLPSSGSWDLPMATEYFNFSNYISSGSIDLKIMFDAIVADFVDIYIGGGVGYAIGNSEGYFADTLLRLGSFTSISDGWFASGILGLRFYIGDIFSIGAEALYRYYMPADKHLLQGSLALGFTF